MVKIRLRRMGAKKAPFYRIVVADSRYPRDGRFIEELGTYNPLKEPAEITVNAESARKWIKDGAQPTDTVRILLKKAGVLSAMDITGIKEMLTYIVGNLVEKPEEIQVNVLENGSSITLQLRVAAEDMGRVIGRQGRIAKEIRTLIRAMGLRDDKRVMVDILD